jgi:predicted SAM-dependent methyltransferase
MRVRALKGHFFRHQQMKLATFAGCPMMEAMRSLIRSIFDKAELPVQSWKRGLSFDRKMVERYLQLPRPHMLHLGCGRNVLPGWLNSDYYPISEKVMFLDAARPFPFPDNSFDFVFSEHMIEHIPYTVGCAMLKECYRVMKPGGKIRISTPNLNFLIDLYLNENTDTWSRYRQWSHNKFVFWAPSSDAAFIINNFVRDWGHQFIYDENALRQALCAGGFIHIARCALNQSASSELANLENETRLPPGFLALETLTLEGMKAPSS